MIDWNITPESSPEDVEATIVQVQNTLQCIPEGSPATPSEIKLHNDLTSYLDYLYEVENCQFLSEVL